MASGAKTRSTEEWEISRSCHRVDVLQRRHHGGPHHPGQAGQVLRQHRVALVGHGRGALLARSEILLGLAHLAALQVADLDRQVLDRGGDDAEGGEEGGMAVARDDLGRDRLDGMSPSFSATWASTAGSMLAKVPTAPEIAQVAISAGGPPAGASRLRAKAA